MFLFSCKLTNIVTTVPVQFLCIIKVLNFSKFTYRYRYTFCLQYKFLFPSVNKHCYHPVSSLRQNYPPRRAVPVALPQKQRRRPKVLLRPPPAASNSSRRIAPAALAESSHRWSIGTWSSPRRTWRRSDPDGLNWWIRVAAHRGRSRPPPQKSGRTNTVFERKIVYFLNNSVLKRVQFRSDYYMVVYLQSFNKLGMH